MAYVNLNDENTGEEMTARRRSVPLEPAAEEVCNQSAVCPRIYQLPPKQGRRKLEEAQSAPVYKYPAEISTKNINTGKWGNVLVYFVKPQGLKHIRDVIFYIHGAGWVFGSFHTHEKLVRELAARTESLVVFPEYSRAPEAKYPVALEQCFFVFSSLWELLGNRDTCYERKILENKPYDFGYKTSGDRLSYPEYKTSGEGYYGFDRRTLTVAGDSVGGNMAIAMMFLREMRGGPKTQKLLLYYPVTDACFHTPSYNQFAENYYLYRAGMQWFWQQYAPMQTDRDRMTASPLRADMECLKTLPDTMIINGQADVLRSEGEEFGERLRCAGVNVTAIRVQGIIHDFVMLNALDRTEACRTAMDASTEWIRRKNRELL